MQRGPELGINPLSLRAFRCKGLSLRCSPGAGPRACWRRSETGACRPVFSKFPDRGEKKRLSPHRQKLKSGDTAVSDVSYASGAFLESVRRGLGKKEFVHFRPPGASAGVLIGGGSQKDPSPESGREDDRRARRRWEIRSARATRECKGLDS